MSEQKRVANYLNQYAESEIEALSDLNVPTVFNHVAVIPCFKEKIDFLDRFTSKESTANALAIVVINQPESADDESSNETLNSDIRKLGIAIDQSENLCLYAIKQTYVLVVEKYKKDNRIPDKNGVGLARKIGCDIALKLIFENKIACNWIYSTDADAHLPENYFSKESFSQGISQASASAMVFNFFHQQENSNISSATQRYEKAIKYYRDGLLWAGSPYSFYTLGSTLAINAIDYCKVRGFPKKAAGEDFYLLNKLAKVGQIVYREDVAIALEPRTSDRVPFGTGPAVQKILDNDGTDMPYYDPRIFKELREVLRISQGIFTDPTLIEQLAIGNQQALNQLGLAKFLKHSQKQCKTEKQFQKSFHDWFDGFLTLRFIHLLQNHQYPARPLSECLALAEEVFV